jgi:predicted RNA binding protein YcfA (HicA-like mRNA interferase family)
MPRRIRDLLRDLRKAGFIPADGGKGSHRKLVHRTRRTLTAIIPGKDGDDAHPYLEKQVAELIRRANLP